jgi:single-strand DNA-binding protein
MLNETQVTFSGWIGTDVTLRDVAGGQQVASFRVATTPRRLRDGEWVDGPTTWHTVKAWNRLARHVAESLSSGQPVLVHGKLVADSWTREDGTAVTSYAVVASSVGHDLSYGTSAFRRPEPASEQSAPASAEQAAQQTAAQATGAAEEPRAA